MKFLSLFLAHASSLLSVKPPSNSLFIGGGANHSRQELSVLKDLVTRCANSPANAGTGYDSTSEDNRINGNVDVPINKEQLAMNILKYKNIYSDEFIYKDEYIKKLELENEKIASELCKTKNLIEVLSTDLRHTESARRSCMIFELYQRFRAKISKDFESCGVLSEGKKLESLLEEVRKGKVYPEDKIVYWMIKFESSSEAQALKKFRNDFAHHTVDDITVLRQWRTDLIHDSSSSDPQINSASIEILNKVIGHLSGPVPKPMQSKNHVEPKVKKAAAHADSEKREREARKSDTEVLRVIKKKLSKKERKIIVKALKDKNK